MDVAGIVFAAIVGIFTVIGAIAAIGYGIFIAIMFVKVVIDRITSDEDNHYSKNVKR